MSGAVATSVFTGLVVSAAGYVASRALAPDAPKDRGPGVAPAPEKPPQSQTQANKTPDERARRASTAATQTGPGRGDTLLTGNAGVAPGSLNLGTNTLLGE